MSIGFHKININRTQTPGKIKKNRGKFLNLFIKGFLLVLLLFIILAIAIAIPGYDLYLSTKKTQAIAIETYSAVKNQDIDKASQKIKELKTNLQDVYQKNERIRFAKFIPFFGSYFNDVTHAINASRAIVEAGDITAVTVAPYSELLGFKGKSTFSSGNVDERLKTAVDTLDKVTPKIDEIAQKISEAETELNYIEPGRYPEKIGTIELRSRITGVKNLFTNTAEIFVQAQPLLKKIPDLMGNKTPKTYLLIFQNDAELRATGGFITAYALFKVDKGKMQVIKADDIYKLDESKKRTYPAPQSILKYHKNVSNLNLRDNNLSPDYKVSMQDFEKMLTESVPDFPKFDGIVAFDTHVLVESIKILGDFNNIYGRNFSAQNDERCNCPKAIYELEDYSTKPVAYIREERKDIIGVLMYEIMRRALGFSPSKYWGKLFQMFLDEAKQKHVLFYFHDDDAQKGIESLDLGGRISDFDGDYIHISNVNFAGAKSNIFVKESIKQELISENDGSFTKTLTINYKNPAPPSNCNLEAGQLCLNGILRNWLRVYVPKGSSLINFSGSEKETVTYDELGKTVFEGFLTVNPKSSSQVIIKYKLPFKLKKGDTYNLLFQKQAGIDTQEYSILFGGREIENSNLLIDKKITFRL